MGIIWIILLLIGLFIIICIFGVAGRILGILADLFMNVVGRGCGNCLGCLFWTFVTFIMGIALIQTLLDAL
jgi:hypothetical protein